MALDDFNNQLKQRLEGIDLTSSLTSPQQIPTEHGRDS